MGTFSQLGGEEAVLEVIEKFASRGKIHMVHFRDVEGNINNFKECFPGDGRYNPAKIMQALHKHGYKGLVLDDHVPFINNDTRWGHTARANVFGYLRGMQKMMELYEK